MSAIRKQGFTIVELIIVIASIAILASLSVFGFSSWRLRTARTEVKTELISASSALKENITFKSTYPATGALNTVYISKAAVTLTYTLRPGGASYCLMGQSTKVTSVTYYIDSTANVEPRTAACS